ncbi:MAG: sugar transferase [Rikenellaceae bacterium]|nr:sugar transferase [Rikenellaceae bacterium]
MVGILPFFAVITSIGCFVYRGRVFFLQERIGHRGKIFRIVKFRTMNEQTDHSSVKLPDAERITRWGAFLRRYSLDEIPQMVHVLTGQMSFIGPRPLIPEHVAGCTAEEFRRHEIRPGITGLAQVRGRRNIPFSKRFRYDVWYIEHLGWRLDAFVLRKTFQTILRTES